MKLTVTHRALADALTVAGRALPGRPPVPVLAGLKLHAADDQLAVTGYDYDTSAYATVAARITEPGTVLVPGRLLTDIARTLRSDVHITTTDTTATLESGSAKFTLRTLPLDEYPKLPTLPALSNASGMVPGADLAEAVSQVATAAARDDSLPVLTGVQMNIDGTTLTLAATDRYRFAVRTLEWEPQGGAGTVGPISQTLLPAKPLMDTAKALAGDPGVFLNLPDQSYGITGFTGDTQRITLRGLEGELPKYKNLFPTEFAAQAAVNTEALAAAVKRVALVAERNTPVRMTFTKSAVTIEAGTSDDAQAVDGTDAAFSVASGEYDTFDVAFNPHFLLDGLTAIGHETTRFQFTHPHKPAMLRADSGPDSRLQYLLMPVRLSG
ncbi:DNA polymerase III subunit beta [Streptomyces sp. CA-111067]|uniref:DNA polymerase III subunit beta n=1 Tax=Streptomyces sp. CA-111067 TaxID=3240046 RepID=UPI003D98C96B